MFYQPYSNVEIIKTFVIQNQQTQFSQVHKAKINAREQFFSTEPLLNNRNNQGLVKIKIYDFTKNSYIQLPQLQNQYLIPMELITKQASDIVLLKYRCTMSETQSSQAQKSGSHDGDNSNRLSQSSSTKKQRSKQRIIIQVIQIVKRWRDLHLQVRQNKKISLLQSAKIVGLPKKSLDDYFYQLRLGQKFGFDFKAHLFDKIGLLRNFLKQNKPKGKSQKADKHPKNLKIIEEFDQISHLMKSQSRVVQQIQEEAQNNQGQYNGDQIFQMEDQQQQSKMILQNRFYQDFQFLLDEPQDPFLSMENGFRKKKRQNSCFQGQFFF